MGLDKFFDLDLIGVRFRRNGLWWCCPNFYSFIFLATKQRLKKNWNFFVFYLLLFFKYVNFRNDFAWVWGWGLWNLWFFFYGVFMLNFLGLWIWFARGFVVKWKMRKSGFELWFCISGFCGLRRSEKICYCVFVCVFARDRFVFVFLYLVDKKGQENARKSGHVFLCLKSGFVFFGVVVEDEYRSKLMYFWILIFFSIC